MIQLETVDPDQASRWEDLVRRCGGNALLLPAIHLAQNPPDGLRLLHFHRDGQTAACALTFQSQGRKLGVPWGDRTLHLPTAPAVADTDLAGDVRQALFAWARQARCDRLVIQPASSQWLVHDADLARFRTASIVEFVIHLGDDPEAVLAGMSKIHRKNVRRAGRQDLRVEEDSSLAGLLELRQMQLSSAERASERTEGFAVSEEDFFRRLYQHVYQDGPGHVLFAYAGDRAVTALAWLSAAGRAVTVRSGSLPEGYEARAMYLLHDALIRRCIAEGVTELNVGGVPAEAAEKGHAQAGLYEFKQGFGGQAMTRFGLNVPLKEFDG